MRGMAAGGIGNDYRSPQLQEFVCHVGVFSTLLLNVNGLATMHTVGKSTQQHGQSLISVREFLVGRRGIIHGRPVPSAL